MEQRIDFVVEGPCVAWHRPEHNRHTGRVFKNKLDRGHQHAIAVAATCAIQKWKAANGGWDRGGEWAVLIEFHLQDLRPKDIDNLEKNVLDGMNGVAYDDDKNVVWVLKHKCLRRSSPHTRVTLHRVEGYLNDHKEPR